MQCCAAIAFFQSFGDTIDNTEITAKVGDARFLESQCAGPRNIGRIRGDSGSHPWLPVETFVDNKSCFVPRPFRYCDIRNSRRRCLIERMEKSGLFDAAQYFPPPRGVCRRSCSRNGGVVEQAGITLVFVVCFSRLYFHRLFGSRTRDFSRETADEARLPIECFAGVYKS